MTKQSLPWSSENNYEPTSADNFVQYYMSGPIPKDVLERIDSDLRNLDLLDKYYGKTDSVREESKVWLKEYRRRMEEFVNSEIWAELAAKRQEERKAKRWAGFPKNE